MDYEAGDLRIETTSNSYYVQDKKRFVASSIFRISLAISVITGTNTAFPACLYRCASPYSLPLIVVGKIYPDTPGNPCNGSENDVV